MQYTPDEWTDLAGYLRPHADDPDGSVVVWTKSFVAGDQDQTADVLRRMLEAFRTNSPTVRGMPRAPSRRARLYARAPAHAGISPG